MGYRDSNLKGLNQDRGRNPTIQVAELEEAASPTMTRYDDQTEVASTHLSVNSQLRETMASRAQNKRKTLQ